MYVCICAIIMTEMSDCHLDQNPGYAAAHTLQAAVRRRRFWRTLAVMRIQRSFRAHLARRLVKGLKEVTRLRSLCR